MFVHATGAANVIRTPPTVKSSVTWLSPLSPTEPCMLPSHNIATLTIPKLNSMRSATNDKTFVNVVISNHSHVLGSPVTLQFELVNRPLPGATSMHSSHNVNADAPLAETMLNAKIAAKASPIIWIFLISRCTLLLVQGLVPKPLQRLALAGPSTRTWSESAGVRPLCCCLCCPSRRSGHRPPRSSRSILTEGHSKVQTCFPFKVVPSKRRPPTAIRSRCSRPGHPPLDLLP